MSAPGESSPIRISDDNSGSRSDCISVHTISSDEEEDEEEEEKEEVDFLTIHLVNAPSTARYQDAGIKSEATADLDITGCRTCEGTLSQDITTDLVHRSEEIVTVVQEGIQETDVTVDPEYSRVNLLPDTSSQHRSGNVSGAAHTAADAVSVDGDPEEQPLAISDPDPGATDNVNSVETCHMLDPGDMQDAGESCTSVLPNVCSGETPLNPDMISGLDHTARGNTAVSLDQSREMDTTENLDVHGTCGRLQTRPGQCTGSAARSLCDGKDPVHSVLGVETMECVRAAGDLESPTDSEGNGGQGQSVGSQYETRTELSENPVPHVSRTRSDTSVTETDPELAPVRSPVKPVRIYHCADCGRHFSQRSGFLRHMVQHTGNKPYSCNACHKTFAYKDSLTYHLKVHAEKTHDRNDSSIFVCDKCGATFGRSSNLRHHYRIHTGERPYVCYLCGQDFNRKANMERHVEFRHQNRDETSERKIFQCSVCSKVYSCTYALERHFRKHVGSAAYHCRVCGKSFLRSDLLNLHMNNKHGGVERVKKLEQFKCTECGAQYANKYNLEGHINSIHKKESPFLCQKCPAKFAKRHDLYIHSRKHRSSTQSCAHCSRVFQTSMDLQDHEQLVHSVTAQKEDQIHRQPLDPGPGSRDRNRRPSQDSWDSGVDVQMGRSEVEKVSHGESSRDSGRRRSRDG